MHITFSTKGRKPFIDEHIKDELYAYIAKICQEYDSPILQIGGVEDHIHMLCQLSRKTALMRLIEEIKSHSSLWIKGKGEKYQTFYWQNGYGGFSVNPTEIETVMDYIRYQKAYHQHKTFQKEYRAFLKKYNVEFDERYVWD